MMKEEKIQKLARDLCGFLIFAFWAIVILLLNQIHPLAAPMAILVSFFFKGHLLIFVSWLARPCAAVAEPIISVLFDWKRNDKN